MRLGLLRIFFLIGIGFTIGGGCTSTQVNKRSHFTASVYEQKEVIKAEVSYELKPLNMNLDKRYFWYNNDSIYSTQGTFSYRVLDGQYERFYASGNIKEQGVFRRGLKDGIWILWTEDGKIKKKERWRNGVLIPPKEKKKHEKVSSNAK